ncbi:orotate phosphoribosyltransferase-like protein [Halobacteriales archaeon QS_1_69_70]|jgi:orotate phosphoribosyltransferase|nr:MAG: orotate phosphoribosyltransferase-like protein [Halobacteriales archaeon QS_1_69_70]
MKNVDDLIEGARDLSERGFSKGEIADELNVSRETASWLVERGGGPTTSDDAAPTGGPHDIHVDWSALGRDAARLAYAGRAMADLLSKQGESVDLTVGIEKAGAPLSTVVARELDTDIATYAPRKHQWEEGDIEELEGTFSRNFADIRDRACYVVDDTITSGTTMRETIEGIRRRGGEPVACVVLVDKQGVDELRSVPVYSLVQAIRVGDGD